MKNWFQEIYSGGDGENLDIKTFSSIADFPEDAFGFVYIVTHKPTGKCYIGKKNLYHSSKKKLGKKEVAKLEDKRSSKIKVVRKESDWKTYLGSSKAILELREKGNENDFTREILKIVSDKRLLTYYECKFLFDYDALEHPDRYLNDNILGKFYSKFFL